MVVEHDESFGARLRRLRLAARLSQEELAERAGLTHNAISALERGERHHPYPHTARALAAALGLADQERVALLAAVPRRAGGVGPAGAAAGRPGEPVAAEPDEPVAPAPRRADDRLDAARAPLVGRAREVAALERHVAGEGPPV